MTIRQHRPAASPSAGAPTACRCGILYMLGATVLFAGSTALSKWQVATYPFSEVLLVPLRRLAHRLRRCCSCRGTGLGVSHEQSGAAAAAA